MISCHSRNLSVPAATLVERGAVLKRLVTKANVIMYHVEFPAKDGVGPISAIWEVESSDIPFLTEHDSLFQFAQKIKS